jgi:hypothetical protein
VRQEKYALPSKSCPLEPSGLGVRRLAVSMKGREGMRPDEGSLSRHVVKLVGASAHPGVITCAHAKKRD